jgi:hypothetical protein
MCQCTSSVWESHPDWPGFYDVSTCGEVRSVDRVIVDHGGRGRRLRGKLLRLTPDDKGYYRVGLHSSGVRHLRLVHQLVLETFIGPKPPGLDGCHWDNDPTNNHLTNLRWDTPGNNNLDKQRHGTDHQRNKVTCPLDHLLVSPNLRADAARIGCRGCLACDRARSNQQHARKHGRPFDLKATADEHYRKIMVGAARRVEPSARTSPPPGRPRWVHRVVYVPRGYLHP